MATYVVKPGDTLSGIAKKLGISNWQNLYNQNKSVIGANPNLIRSGQSLTDGSTAPVAQAPVAAAPTVIVPVAEGVTVAVVTVPAFPP